MVYVCPMSMPNERTRDRGNLFEYAEKQKPSSPAFHGDCIIGGNSYEIRGWRRQDQLAITLAPPRGDKNTFPPDVFRGALEAAPEAPKPAGGGKKKKGVAKVVEAAPAVVTPAWSGDIVSDEAAYAIRAFEKQGKSGLYWTLSFERVEMPPPSETLWESADGLDA